MSEYIADVPLQFLQSDGHSAKSGHVEFRHAALSLQSSAGKTSVASNALLESSCFAGPRNRRSLRASEQSAAINRAAILSSREGSSPDGPDPEGLRTSTAGE